MPVDSSPMAMLALAVQKGMDPATIKDLMDLRDRLEATEALKAFNVAFAAFKAETIKLLRDTPVTDGPLKGKKYSSKFAVVNAVTTHLSAHGLSSSWRLTKDEKDWIEVTCSLKHVLGHSESVAMGGPPDTGPGRNVIQSRSSTNSYLEKLTLKAICGIAEQGDDNDGAGARDKGMDEGALADHISAMEACADLPSLQKAFGVAYKAAQAIPDKGAMGVLTRSKDARKAALTRKEGAK